LCIAQTNGMLRLYELFATSELPVLEETNTEITNISPSPSDIGNPVAFTFAVSSSGGIPSGYVSVNVGMQSCVGALENGEGNCDLSFNETGIYSVTAVYYGDELFNQSISSSVDHKVRISTDLVMGSYPNPSLIGEPVEFHVTVESPNGVPQGSVSINDGEQSCIAQLYEIMGDDGPIAEGFCSLTFDNVGSHPIDVTYQGDSDFSPSNTTGYQIVQANTVTRITSQSLNPSSPGDQVWVTYSVTSTGGIPTGWVVVTDGNILCTHLLPTDDQSCLFTFNFPGDRTIWAEYQGDDYFNPSVAEIITQTVKAVTITTITKHDPNPSELGEPVSIEFLVETNYWSPIGTVAVRDGMQECSAPLENGSGECTISFSSGGLHHLTATYSGVVSSSRAYQTRWFIRSSRTLQSALLRIPLSHP